MPADASFSSPSCRLSRFAAANDAAAATSAKLEKQAALAGYLRELGDDDLRLAARYAAGRAFAATDERVLGVSGSTVSSVILSMFRLDPAQWHTLTREAGEIGEAMATLWHEHVDPRDPERPMTAEAEPLVLADLQATWNALARVEGVGGQEAKRAILADLFARIQTPREAAYVGKIIFGDLRTGVREGVLHAAIAEAFGRDLEAVRRAILLVGDVGEVAVMARHERLAEAAFTLFHPIGFMLATPVETPLEAVNAIAKGGQGRQETEDRRQEAGRNPIAPTGSGPPPVSSLLSPVSWIAEHKLDGIRAQIHKAGDGAEARIAIYTRTMDRADDSFPEIVNHTRVLPGEWLLDGEIVPFDDATVQVLAFANIQKRLGRKRPTAKFLKDYPCRFFAFDLLFHDGENLLDAPLRERRERMIRLLEGQEQIRRLQTDAVTDTASVEKAFEAARAARNEGLILKDLTSPYAPGRRGGAWLKLKTHLPTLDVVVTAAEYGHGKRRGSLSDYTFAVWDRDPDEPKASLVNIGKAFSGVTDEEIAKLTDLFLSIQTGQHGRVYTVSPQIVLEVAFDAIQESKRHAGGFALRFPRIKHIRWDREPASADRIERVREIFEHEQNLNRPAKRPESPPAQMGLFE